MSREYFLQLAARLYGDERRARDARERFLPPLVTFTREEIEIHGLRVVKKETAAPRPAEYLSALEVLDREERVLLKGPAGMGKSAFLKMTALALAGERAGDIEFNLAWLTTPVERMEKPCAPEPQAWSHGALLPLWLDAAEWLRAPAERRALETFLDGPLPAGGEGALLLVDNLDRVDPGAWAWMRPALEDFLQAHPGMRLAGGARDDTLRRLRPALAGAKEFSLRGLTMPLAHRAAEMLGAGTAGADALLSAPTWHAAAARNPQHLTWLLPMLADGAPGTWAEFYARVERAARASRPADVEPAGELALYLAARDALRSGDLSTWHALLLSGERWPLIEMVLRLLDGEERSKALDLAARLVPEGSPRPQEEDCAAALLAGELYAAARAIEGPETSGGLSERLRAWLLAIVSGGWMTPCDRRAAGMRLAWLGDPRDFDELASVPAGEFTMGSSNRPSETPAHRVRLGAYRIGKYPVVNSQYRRFVEATGREWVTPDGRQPERANMPATSLTWYDAAAYCRWLTGEWRREGRIGPQDVVRLPTEAEWERAARGGPHGERGGLLYPWGAEWDDDACSSLETGFNDTCAVGMFPRGASACGCLDMSGQVWEWVSTIFGPDARVPAYPYPYDGSDGREAPEAPDHVRRVLRGGSFASPFDKVTCTYRGSLEPVGYWRGDGFRVVVAPQKEGEE
ncbi:MAG TPA: formylglycine-generating enzyme family protein [Chloroflexi bacterium]|nr:formylglycine-generating enzyme family protein [Chloroflexota bacterium]